MIGHDLGGRYEILTRIGGGGMALVYKAHDVLLNRKVAVKVLRQQFVHDEEFIRRFRREAQSAASLSHPNVVSIYDVGQEEDIHYIVMEYIEGHNLNEIIQERAPLQTEESVRIAQQICDALDHAHHNQIIHRDIKPHNILIGKNGRVKVTDFGIARAVTSSTITQTGSVVGSVHYFSPEHAKGISTGEKSDLYSLGIVLYQMLTAKLPFLGESPISVALKHLQENFEEPRVVNPHIPQSVENVILRSMRKNPNERYNSAQEMMHDLETCLKPERLREPKAVFTSDHDLDETRVMPALKEMRSVEGTAVPTATLSGKEQQWDTGKLDDQRKRGWKRPVTIVGVTLVILALIIAGFIYLLGRLDAPEVKVPYVIGKTLDEARKELTDAGLEVEEPVVRQFKKDVPKDQVYDQTKSNMMAKEGSTVKLYVSDGPPLSQLESQIGQTLESALQQLADLGVDRDTQIDVREEFSDKDPGIIIDQTPDGGVPFDPETEQFTFTVSKGPETFKMPDLTGMTEKEALDMIKANDLVIDQEDIVRTPSYAKKGTVLDQSPYKAGEAVTKGAKVSITVASGFPKDAIEATFQLDISPAVAGKASEVRIVYNDATGENIEWGKRQITDMQRLSVKVVVDPDNDALISVTRDGQYIDTYPVTYEEALAGGTLAPDAPAGATEPPADEPANTQTSNNDSEANNDN
ncbi:Stk1 family PASTA domain-containing Ser/Thr kinase [Paenibacillus sp. GCM10023252]|uniref:Stk1 family PASTA domain-containing Ser/Thr kinase n=1 Tax=Paenibacillus sp. GCM10023252 TaxID=3252649 RepID=UPI00360A7BD5